jgi:hyperosmotically inducible periplasmic protein
MRKAQALLLSLGMAMSMSAFAQTSATQSIDDAGTTARVKTALIGNKQAKASQINVETQQGVVQLSGFVDSEAARKAAVTTARNVTGVKDVRDKLMIRDGERTTGEAVDDTVIAAKVKSELAGKAGLSTASNVTVEVNRGVVQLSGFVTSADQKASAGAIAHSVAGVKDVENNIELKPRS